MVSRRDILAGMGLGATLSLLPRPSATSLSPVDNEYESFPKTPAQLAADIVGAAHVDIDKVKSLIQLNPSLARASVDWGFGDWETAVGAASHMGRLDILELLLSHGAPSTLFAHVALDQVDVVRAICLARPGTQKTLGPHGITLMKHAIAGKATRVIEFLTELGQSDEAQADAPLSEEEKKTYLGKYDFGNGTSDFLEIGTGRTNPRLGIRRGEASYRFLANLGEHRFTVFGSPHVEITFEVSTERASQLRIQFADIDMRATRIVE